MLTRKFSRHVLNISTHIVQSPTAFATTSWPESATGRGVLQSRHFFHDAASTWPLLRVARQRDGRRVFGNVWSGRFLFFIYFRYLLIAGHWQLPLCHCHCNIVRYILSCAGRPPYADRYQSPSFTCIVLVIIIIIIWYHRYTSSALI